MWMTPDTGVFRVNIGQANISAYTLFKAMGVDDRQMADAVREGAITKGPKREVHYEVPSFSHMMGRTWCSTPRKYCRGWLRPGGLNCSLGASPGLWGIAVATYAGGRYWTHFRLKPPANSSLLTFISRCD